MAINTVNMFVGVLSDKLIKSNFVVVVVESGSLRLQNTVSDYISPMVSVFGEAL